MNIAPFKTESGVENSVQDLLFSNIEFTSQRIPFDHFEEPSSFLAYIKNEFKTLKSGFTLTDFEVVQIIYFIGNSDDQIKLDAMENLKYQIKYHRTQLSESQLSQILPIVTSMSPDTIMTSLDLLYYIVQTNCASNIEMIPFEFLDLFHEIIRNNSFPQSKPLFKSILRLLNLITKHLPKGMGFHPISQTIVLLFEINFEYIHFQALSMLHNLIVSGNHIPENPDLFIHIAECSKDYSDPSFLLVLNIMLIIKTKNIQWFRDIFYNHFMFHVLTRLEHASEIVKIKIYQFASKMIDLYTSCFFKAVFKQSIADFQEAFILKKHIIHFYSILCSFRCYTLGLLYSGTIDALIDSFDTDEYEEQTKNSTNNEILTILKYLGLTCANQCLPTTSFQCCSNIMSFLDSLPDSDSIQKIRELYIQGMELMDQNFPNA